VSKAARQLSPDDPRPRRFPRFQGENLLRNLELAAGLEQFARAAGVTLPQLAFAWVLSRGEDIIPLIGTTRASRLAEALGALELQLSPDEQAALASVAEPARVAGHRYDDAGMASLDSEKAHTQRERGSGPGAAR
jgi:aryl-alcohol dehydrogenase-like predicted oxidoreductase